MRPPSRPGPAGLQTVMINSIFVDGLMAMPGGQTCDQRMRSEARTFLRLLIGWSFVGAYRASHEWTFLRARTQPASPLDLVWPYLLVSVSWAILTWVVFRIAYGVPFERIESWRTLLLIFVPTVIGIALLSVGSSYLVYRISGRDPGPPIWFFLNKFHPTLLDTFIVLGLACSVRIRDVAAVRAIEAAHMETMLANAQTQVLRSQIQPHFLFNALHSVSSMIHHDPEKADRMVAQLSALLRVSVDISKEQQVPFITEIDFARRYLEIQQTRFSDRLRVEWNIAPETVDTQVPALLLQPLVENSVKHGLSRSDRIGIIRISSALADGVLTIRVEDNGSSTASDPDLLGEGIGLSNTRERLKRVCGSDAEIRLHRAQPGGGMTVTVTVPLRSEPVSDGQEPGGIVTPDGSCVSRKRP